MKILKVLFNILSLLIIIAVAYLGVINAGTMINFIIKGTVGINAATTHISLVYVIFATLIAGIIAGAF